ncbi:MAG: TonB-dependent receptor domain-containing protein, partial [Pyrinomonadaceae bacterium]
MFVPIYVLSQQTDANLTGVVTDPAGAALGGVQISATNSLTKEISQAITDAQGQFTLANLLPGQYTLEAKADNFRPMIKEVRLDGNKTVTVDFQLLVQLVTESVTVTARTELERVPGSIALIPQKEIEQSRANNLRDVLGLTPGVIAQPRYGTDELQFSIRGSGLRSNFHERGINIYVNGMPYQDADGFSDYEALELMATQRVEVWKGANALRFGANSMGGAINFITQSGETASPLQINLVGGSYGSFKGQISTGGVRGPFSYYLSASASEFKGYREHSQQGRQRLYGNLNWRLDDKTALHFDLIYANIAEKLPGSLTRQEFFADPRQADANSVRQDMGRFIDFTRAGFQLSRQLDDRQEISVSVYGQYRNLDHPIFEVFDQDARSFGSEVRYSFNGRIGARGNRFVIGFTPQRLLDGERHFENINGGRGERTKLFDAQAVNYGIYFENQLDISPIFTIVAGGRMDWATRRFDDHFLTDGDQSDRRTYQAFSPKLGFVWRPREDVQLFGNVSRSYEPPLLLELTSFASFDAAGFIPLEAQDTWQYEIGTRGRLGDRINWEVAAFDLEINNEIINLNVEPFPFAPFTIPTFRNAASTRHRGLEVGTGLLLGHDLLREKDRLTWNTAYTLSQFRFVDDNSFGDNYIPGAPRHLLRSELRYDHPSGLWIAPNIDWSPASYFVNSANTDRNDKYAVLNLKGGYD